MHACNIGILEFLVTGLYVVIFVFFWRAIAAKFSDTKIGQGMAAIL